MLFKIDHLLPHPLKEQRQNNNLSQIWGTNCQFEKGKHYLVSAASGKGKSTLLHILYGLRKDYSGSVSLNGENIDVFPNERWSDLRKDHLSIVFQNLRLFPKLSALDNILIKSKLTDYRTKDQIIQMSKQLGIASLLQHKCGKLSYGQQQRVAIVRALCQPFDFLLLDEPFSHLDEANVLAAMELIRNACLEQGAGMILVSLGEDFNVSYDQKLIL